MIARVMARHPGRIARRPPWVVLAATLALAPAAVAAGERWTRLGDAAAWAARCRVGDETRPAASCTGRAVARLDVAVPPLEDGDRIEIATAVRPPTNADARPGPTRVRAWLAADDGSHGATLWERTLDPAREDDGGWQSTVAAVPARAGDARTLVLESDAAGDRPPSPVIWARPVLRRAGATPAVPGVVVVSLDGLRADRVASAAGPHPATPILDRLARAGIVFERAWAATPGLHPSRVSMLTGRLPCERGGARGGVTIGTRLQAAGWATAVVGDDAGLARLAGFDRAWVVAPGTLAAATHLADRWVGDVDGAPFLLVVQSAQITRPDLAPSATRTTTAAPPASPAGRARARYDAAVTWTDEALGGLLGVLTGRHLVGRAPLVVMSAAGFALGEHGDVGPARTLHAEALHVPLVVHHPALGRPRQVPFPVELRDLPRTILDLAGVAAEAGMPGESLLPVMLGAVPAAPYVPGDRRGSPRATVLRTARFAWLLDGERLALYDLAADPTEQTDVAEKHPDVAADGRARIQAFRARCARGP